MGNEPNFAQNFVSETASEHVRTLVPVASPHTRVSELRRSVEGVTFESATHIGICNNGKLVGVLRIEDLLSAPPDAKVSYIMDEDPSAVARGVDQEKAAWKAVQHGESEPISEVVPLAWISTTRRVRSSHLRADIRLVKSSRDECCVRIRR